MIKAHSRITMPLELSQAAASAPQGEVTVRAAEFHMILDCIACCARSVREAQHVCDKAASAFRAEAAALEASHAAMTMALARRPVPRRGNAPERRRGATASRRTTRSTARSASGRRPPLGSGVAATDGLIPEPGPFGLTLAATAAPLECRGLEFSWGSQYTGR